MFAFLLVALEIWRGGGEPKTQCEGWGHVLHDLCMPNLVWTVGVKTDWGDGWGAGICRGRSSVDSSEVVDPGCEGPAPVLGKPFASGTSVLLAVFGSSGALTALAGACHICFFPVGAGSCCTTMKLCLALVFTLMWFEKKKTKVQIPSGESK